MEVKQSIVVGPIHNSTNRVRFDIPSSISTAHLPVLKAAIIDELTFRGRGGEI